MQKLVSWNVNGLRACMNKGFMDTFNALDADVFCLQETKMQPHQLELDLPGYYQYWNSADKKGYSGTAVFTKQKPLAEFYGLGIDERPRRTRHHARIRYVLPRLRLYAEFQAGIRTSFIPHGLGR